MKLLTWNCQGAFRKKYPLIAALRPDLAVIPECESLDKIPWKAGDGPVSAFWYGDKPSKGLGVFSWTHLAFEELPGWDDSIRYCIPLRITAPYPFHLIAVWAMDHPQDNLSYSAQIFQAVARYREFIQAADTLMMGDFNSSQRTPRSRIGNHTTLTTAIEDLWMVSAYHHFFHEKAPKETRGTFFRGRKPDAPAHIDYAYIPVRWLRRLRRVEVGAPAAWLEHSDHCPVIVEIEPKDQKSIV